MCQIDVRSLSVLAWKCHDGLAIIGNRKTGRIPGSSGAALAQRGSQKPGRDWGSHCWPRGRSPSACSAVAPPKARSNLLRVAVAVEAEVLSRSGDSPENRSTTFLRTYGGTKGRLRAIEGGLLAAFTHLPMPPTTN